jgi:uncharacterized protein
MWNNMAFYRSTHRTAASAVRFVFAFFLVVCAAACSPASQAADPARLVIDTQGGARVFTVEVASSEAQREQGLMWRTELAPEAGMLFDFGQARDVSMWMKNTYIPLDMVFIREDGRIHRIESNTVPHSTRIIESGAPVRFVLELPGGTAHRLGIRPGDRVRHALIR